MFSNNSFAKNVTNVGELIKELSLLPPDMPVGDGEFNIDVVVFNRKDPNNEHVGFEDGGEWDATVCGMDEEH